MRKKVVTILLMVAVMASTVLTGCGGQQESDSAMSAENDASAESADDAGNGDATEGESGEWEYKEARLSITLDNSSALDGFMAVAELAEKKLGITLDIEYIPGGEEGLNIAMTRLAAGEMSDLMVYNSGGVMKSLGPEEYFMDLSNEAFADKLNETYKESVTVDGKLYGIPLSSSSSGAILYNKEIYAELGLEVPKTWNDFMANCKAVDEAGKTAIIGTFADNWTCQVMVLGDFYNIQSGNPNFATDFEQGRAKYATDPYALASWKKLQDTVGFYNEDYVATTYDDGCDMLVNGDGAHWIILSQVLSNIYSLYGDEVDNIGLFAIPGDNAEDNGLTVWMPMSIYGVKNSEHADDVKRFMEFYVSDEALDAYAAAQLPDGPYCVNGYELPENVFAAVKDAQAYFDAGKTSTAMEFNCKVTPTSGGNICAECGTGQSTAEEAANAWDEDCRKRAFQLGIEWE